MELGYQQMKEELGLDHHEGRSWRGFHHHACLVMLAYGFLALEQRRARRGRPRPGKRGAPSPGDHAAGDPPGAATPAGPGQPTRLRVLPALARPRQTEANGVALTHECEILNPRHEAQNRAYPAAFVERIDGARSGLNARARRC